MFNIDRYHDDKKNIVSMIKKTLPDWATTEGFIADGLLDPNQYARESLKIVCFFSESYGWDAMERVTDIEQQQHFLKDRKCDVVGTGNYRVRVTSRIAAALWLLFESIQRNEKVTFSEFRAKRLFQNSSTNLEIRHHTLAKIGWVNVKKASKPAKYGTRENYEEVCRHAKEKNHTILKRQLDSMSPDLLLVCSNAAFNSLSAIGIIGNQTCCSDFFHLSHPSVWWSYKRAYENFERVFDFLASKGGNVFATQM